MSAQEQTISADAAVAACPMRAGRDDRKSAKSIEKNLKPFPGSKISKSFNLSRDILRSPHMRQAGSLADEMNFDNPDHISFFFLDGELHRRRRATVAGYFTPKAIVTRYHPIMQRTMDELIAELQSKGSAKLDEMSFRLAAYVTMDILGLSQSSGKKNMEIAKRIRTILNSPRSFDRSLYQRVVNKILLGWLHSAIFSLRTLRFYHKDITPAAEARRKDPQDDVITYMVKEGYSMKAMLIETLTYGGAGVSTTREFMVMAAWHLFDNPELKEKFLNADEEGQFAILEEILRLDPIAGYLYRRSTEDIPEIAGEPVKDGDLFAIDIRASNTDEKFVGECPYQIDPDRAKRVKIKGTYLSFGDGPHRCPGAQVALHESRIFLDRLLRVPGIRLVSEPHISWNMSSQGYELRGAVVTCDRA
jgi:cytochrome P450